MKKLTTFVLMVVMGVGAYAQEEEDTEVKRGQWSVGFSLDLCSPSEVSMDDGSETVFKEGWGLSVGGFYNVSLGKTRKWFIEPGVKLYYTTYSSRDGAVSGGDKLKLDKFGVRVPIHAGYRFRLGEQLNLAVFTGPVFDLGIAGREKIEGSRYNASVLPFGDKGDFKRFNFLWSLGAAIEYGCHSFGMELNMGCVNMYGGSQDYSFTDNVMSWTYAYKF